ncbi:MAG: YbgC/FadM family acyl-CoA thioesterase, partial [Pseudomonadota bacterium]
MSEGGDRQARDEGWFEGRIYVRPIRIYYEDTDFSGVVYHANHLRYFERGRSDFFRLAGVSHADLASRAPPLVFSLRRVEVEYFKPARIDDLLLVRTAYEELRGARVVAAQRLERDGELLAAA